MRKILIANWKMHKTRQEADLFLSSLVLGKNLDLWIAASFTLLEDMCKHPLHERVKIGAQNMSPFIEGAYTGEVSLRMLKDVGSDFVILGHSERRTLFQESDEEIGSKVKAAVEGGLIAVLCVGETLDERERGDEHKVIQRQLKIGLNGLTETEMKKVMISYEPVWAIGSGHAATPDEASEVHEVIKMEISKLFPRLTKGGIPVLYGGSVNEKNLLDFLSKESIDGALVGGAALAYENVNEMIQTLED